MLWRTQPLHPDTSLHSNWFCHQSTEHQQTLNCWDVKGITDLQCSINPITLIAAASRKSISSYMPLVEWLPLPNSSHISLASVSLTWNWAKSGRKKKQREGEKFSGFHQKEKSRRGKLPPATWNFTRRKKRGGELTAATRPRTSEEEILTGTSVSSQPEEVVTDIWGGICAQL